MSCSECNKECKTCNNNKSCLECNDEYYMNLNNECVNKSNIIGCSVEISTTEGCTECQDGYYNSQKECFKCNENCKTCSNKDSCLSCIDSLVMKNGDKVYLAQKRVSLIRKELRSQGVKILL